MEEKKEEIDPRKITMSKTYSITYAHVNMVKEMADKLTMDEGKIISDGEIVRRAIDLLYATTYNQPVWRPLA